MMTTQHGCWEEFLFAFFSQTEVKWNVFLCVLFLVVFSDRWIGSALGFVNQTPSDRASRR